MKYSIVIPARNEEQRLRDTVLSYATCLEARGLADDAEIWLVVNGSDDGTDAVAARLATELGLVRHVVTAERLGKGGAVRRGFALASGDVLAFVDADNSTPPDQLHELFAAIDDGADAAIGSRWLRASRQVVAQPLPRRAAGRLFNRLVRLAFGLDYADTQCGAKAFRSAAYRAIEPWLALDGWAFDVEILIRLEQHGFRVEEVPIAWSDASGSRLRFHRDGPAVLLDLVRLRRALAKRVP